MKHGELLFELHAEAWYAQVWKFSEEMASKHVTEAERADSDSHNGSTLESEMHNALAALRFLNANNPGVYDIYVLLRYLYETGQYYADVSIGSSGFVPFLVFMVGGAVHEIAEATTEEIPQ